MKDALAEQPAQRQPNAGALGTQKTAAQREILWILRIARLHLDMVEIQDEVAGSLVEIKGARGGPGSNSSPAPARRVPTTRNP